MGASIVLERLGRRFPDALLGSSSQHGDDCVIVRGERLTEVATFLRDDPELLFDLPVDCTALDHLGKREPRFEVVYHLYSMQRGYRLRVKIPVAEHTPAVASLTPVWPGMNWHERETWDMYGIRFLGHPNLKRALMYEEFQGHPLRKDYPIDKRQPLIDMRPVREMPTQRLPPPELLNKP